MQQENLNQNQDRNLKRKQPVKFPAEDKETHKKIKTENDKRLDVIFRAARDKLTSWLKDIDHDEMFRRRMQLVILQTIGVFVYDNTNWGDNILLFRQKNYDPKYYEKYEYLASFPNYYDQCDWRRCPDDERLEPLKYVYKNAKKAVQQYESKYEDQIDAGERIAQMGLQALMDTKYDAKRELYTEGSKMLFDDILSIIMSDKQLCDEILLFDDLKKKCGIVEGQNQTDEEYEKYVEKCKELLKGLPQYITDRSRTVVQLALLRDAHEAIQGKNQGNGGHPLLTLRKDVSKEVFANFFGKKEQNHKSQPQLENIDKVNEVEIGEQQQNQIGI